MPLSLPCSSSVRSWPHAVMLPPPLCSATVWWQRGKPHDARPRCWQTSRMNDLHSSGFASRLIAQLPSLRRYATAICGDRAFADDLVQDGIERALNREASLHQPEKLGAWLRSIVHHLFLDELRRRRVRGVALDVADMANDLAFSHAATADGPLNDVTRAMAGLSLEHRQILVLVGVEELTYREIADELRIPIGTVMSRLARARAALRTALEPAAPLTNPARSIAPSPEQWP